MEKRKILIGSYDTALEGLWTLTAWLFSKAVAQESYADVPGHNGQLDLSTVLTDGEPYYGNREFEATFESSEGTRLEREERINTMINRLDGRRFNIYLPDDPLHYINGRVRVEKLYNDPAHASVIVTATCDPWRYNLSETVVGLIASSTEQVANLKNNGRRAVVPVVNTTGSVNLRFIIDGVTYSKSVSAGEHVIADLYLKTGSVPLYYSGSGQITLTYREAVL